MVKIGYLRGNKTIGALDHGAYGLLVPLPGLLVLPLWTIGAAPLDFWCRPLGLLVPPSWTIGATLLDYWCHPLGLCASGPSDRPPERVTRADVPGPGR